VRHDDVRRRHLPQHGDLQENDQRDLLDVSSVFDNDGTVDVQTGGLQFSGGGGATTNTGSFDATGAALEFGGGTFNLAAGSSITGTNVTFSGATVNHSGTYNVTASTTVSGGTMNLTGTVTSAGTSLRSPAGRPTSRRRDDLPDDADVTNGTLTGSDNIDVSGLTTGPPARWTGRERPTATATSRSTARARRGSRAPSTPRHHDLDRRQHPSLRRRRAWNNSGTLDAQADGTGSTLFDAGPSTTPARSSGRRSRTSCT
jgi:hypothetical protein